MYVYINFEPGLWTVGFYKPSGEWEAESNHNNLESAVARVHYLNGGDIDNEEAINPWILSSEEIDRMLSH